MVSIVWFRRDLRVSANPALRAAAKRGPVLPVFILDPGDLPGAAGHWWLGRSLKTLADSLGGLWLGVGDPAMILNALAREVQAEAVYWNRICEPDRAGQDMRIARALKSQHVAAVSFDDGSLLPPELVMTRAGSPFRVFTPFWRAYQGHEIPAPEATATPEIVTAPGSLSLADLNFTPEPGWTCGWGDIWKPGEAGAQIRWQHFLETALDRYPQQRDFPAVDGVSRLSPHLHWGEISPRMMWASVLAHLHIHSSPGAEGFLRQLVWRDFAQYLLWHTPTMAKENWNAKFDRFEWRSDPQALKAWQKGQTGFPLVDAGMRELWQTGWMHNRVRMVVASFLTKDLRIHWREGMKWFADTLLDGDLAVNAASWQWVAGCGADAAPYFRIFSPTSQAKRFDPDGAYIRRWCPELADLDNRVIHDPPPDMRGEYPLPMLDHDAARKAALAAYYKIRDGSAAFG